MSAADLMPAIQSLPKDQKVELYWFLANELAKDASPSGVPVAFIPPPQDACPYSPNELARMFEETGGAPLSDIWRELGVR